MSDEPTSVLTGATTTTMENARQTIVLDTSVLIADPTCITQFTGVDIVIPLTVVEELDGLKVRPDDVGRAARMALRSIEDARIAAGGSLKNAAALAGHDTTLRIEMNGALNPAVAMHGLDPRVPDNRIIGAALEQASGTSTIVVSNDAALRIKAAHLGLDAVEHCRAGRSIDDKSVGWTSIDVDTGLINRLYNHDLVNINELDERNAAYENEFIVMRAGSQSALVRRYGEQLMLLSHSVPEAWGLRPRSKEQRFALELLLDPQIKVIALDGRAGTGKTLLAVAAGLEQVVERRIYEHLAIYRPLIPVGRADVGFLPGGLDEKLDPWMSAIYDAIVALTDRHSSADAQALVEELTVRGQLSLESVTFLRGRSLHRQFIVVDEAQNLEPTTLKTILTRVGEGTKVVFTGDTSQIDAPYLGESNNALAVLISAFRGQECFGNITLTTGERSAVANLAAELL